MDSTKFKKWWFTLQKIIQKGNFKIKIEIAKPMDTKLGVTIVEKLGTLHLIAILWKFSF